ncbi:MAG: nitroreductase family protein [Desulfurococcaceae archaeon]
MVAEVIKSRRTIREFTDETVPRDIVEKILDIATT